MDTPLEALDAAIWRIHLLCSGRYTRKDSKPGQLISELSPKHRALLKDLKSSDIENLRPDAIIL